jgi:ProP effector
MNVGRGRLRDILRIPDIRCKSIAMNTKDPASAPSPFQAARDLLKEFQRTIEVFRNCMPLAIGIDKQLMKRFPDVDRKVLRIALGIHTNSVRYLKAMEKATARFDLDAKPAAEIPEAHRAHASKLLQERLKKDAERRKAQEAERKAAEEELRRAEKLAQLAAKFSRRTG